ncbi:MAG TPA: type VI secretion system TssO [Parafilimonas sp.]|nr:type VI secretion system TssO [Parafilimonas sp.]
MKSINYAERQRAFLKFLLFFVITIAVVIVAVLFSVQVPLKENKQFKGQMMVMVNEKDFLASFENNVQQITNLLYSLDTVKNYNATDVAIDSKIDDLYKQLQVEKDTISAKNLCMLILDNLSNYHKAKQDSRNRDNNAATIQQLNDKVSEYRKAWTDCLNGRAAKASSGN